ncbi:1248_t:CDS:1, partial [Rhizophagus irregularis]
KNACQALATHENNAFFGPCRILPNKSGTIVKETWFPGVHSEIGGGAFLSFKGNERITNATLLWMIENIVEVGGLLMHDDIETYRNRFSPDIGPSWNLMNYIFDHISSIFPAILVKDRTIPLELDSSQKFLRKDLLYRDGDWLLPFGVRSYMYTQYFSKTYENLRKDMETKGIKLYDNKRYDMDISKKA